MARSTWTGEPHKDRRTQEEMQELYGRIFTPIQQNQQAQERENRSREQYIRTLFNGFLFNYVKEQHDWGQWDIQKEFCLFGPVTS